VTDPRFIISVVFVGTFSVLALCVAVVSFTRTQQIARRLQGIMQRQPGLLPERDQQPLRSYSLDRIRGRR
jgi:hypothetical protein